MLGAERAPRPTSLSSLPLFPHLLLSMPAPEAGPPRPPPFPHRLGGSRNTPQRCPPQKKGLLPFPLLPFPQLPTPSSGADSELHPHCPPSLRPTRHPLQTAHLSAVPAQACARMGLLSLRRGCPEPRRLREGLPCTPAGGFPSLQRPAESGGSEQARRKRT